MGFFRQELLLGQRRFPFNIFYFSYLHTNIGPNCLVLYDYRQVGILNEGVESGYNVGV
jgi:hypothetical protein